MTATNRSLLNPSRLSWGSLLLLFVLVSAPAFARTWHITHFDARCTVAEDGTVLVEEEIHPLFQGAYNGILRDIPVEYPGPDGTNYRLLVKVASVTDENGSPIKFEQSSRNQRVAGGAVHQFLVLKIYAAGTDTERTVRITYRVQNAIRYFKDFDEFYWNVTGLDTPVLIDAATATVALPATAAGQLQAKAYTGVYGSRGQDATVTIDGANISFDANHALPARNGLTLDIRIPKGVLTPPSALTRILWFVSGNPGVFLPLWAFIVMIVIWWFKGRDAESGLSVAPMYEPPPGMTPAEAGTLITDNIEARDITCTVIDLAVKGYIKIIETENKILLFTHKDYILRLMKPRSEWQGLATHEEEILNNLFPEVTAEETTLSDLKNRFYIALPSIREEILGALRSKDLYSTDPETAKGLVVTGVLVIALPFLWLQMTGRIRLFGAPTVLVAGIALSALIVYLFGRHLAAKTVRGARARVQCLGFKEFLTRVDGDRIKRMPPDTFERFLPYAMAFGVEQHWAQAFQGIITEPPTWYVGAGYGMGMMWNPLMFCGAMNSFSTSAFQMFSAAPQASSSGSGFGGSFGGGDGGFSGGGFGGGGTDAF